MDGAGPSLREQFAPAIAALKATAATAREHVARIAALADGGDAPPGCGPEPPLPVNGEEELDIDGPSCPAEEAADDSHQLAALSGLDALLSLGDARPRRTLAPIDRFVPSGEPEGGRKRKLAADAGAAEKKRALVAAAAAAAAGAPKPPKAAAAAAAKPPAASAKPPRASAKPPPAPPTPVTPSSAATTATPDDSAADGAEGDGAAADSPEAGEGGGAPLSVEQLAALQAVDVSAEPNRLADAAAESCPRCANAGGARTLRCDGQSGCPVMVHAHCFGYKEPLTRYVCRHCRAVGLLGCAKCRHARGGCADCRGGWRPSGLASARSQAYPSLPSKLRCQSCPSCLNRKLKKACVTARALQMQAAKEGGPAAATAAALQPMLQHLAFEALKQKRAEELKQKRAAAAAVAAAAQGSA